MDESFPLVKENPKEKASYFSKLCFLWTSECISIASSGEVKLEELLYKCTESYSSNKIGNHLEEEWNEELQKCRKRNLKPSLLRTIVRVFYPEYLPLAVTAFLNYVVMKGLQPLILSNLIRLFITKNYTAVEMLLYAGCLCLLILASTFLLHHTVCGSNLLGIKISQAVSSLVFKKVLRLNQVSLSTTSSGQVINLLSNDVVRFRMLVQAFHFLWMTPIQVTVIIFVIWSIFGLGALIGISTLIILMIPFQGFLGHLTGVYRKNAAEKTDSRVKLTNEIFSAMGVIKMYTWENPFQKIIQRMRGEELNYIRRTSYIRGILACMMFLTEKLGLCVTVVSYSLIGFPVFTDVVFSVSVCFRILQYSLGAMLPAAITIGSEVLVSAKRLEEFLMLDEIDPATQNVQTSIETGRIHLKGVSAFWKEKDISLDNVSIFIPTGSLCAVVGPVGSGKSSLLKFLLGELPITNGILSMKGVTSFSSQKPWLFSSTIRRNIVFHRDYNEMRYKKVLEVCGLIQDMEELPNGDQTVVGSRGTSLSGGQRARISLARAVYQEADIYLLDDILSALDSKIGKYVFQECILKFLCGKTRLLVTHQLHYLKEVENIIVLNKGSVEKIGSFTKLFGKDLQPYLKVSNIEENIEKNMDSVKYEKPDQVSYMEGCHSSVSQIDDVNNAKGSVILKYIRCSGSFFNIGLFLAFLIISQLSLNLSDYWITLWSEQENIRYFHRSSINSPSSAVINNETSSNFIQSMNDTILSQWLDTVYVDGNQYILIKSTVMRTLYIIIIVLAIILVLLRSSLFFYLCINASQCLHDKMFSSLLGTSLSFFHNTPPGNILNRFSKDMGAADELFPKALLNVLASVPILFGSMLLIAISNSFMLILIIPLCLLLLKIKNMFLATVKVLRRLEAAVKSPIFSLVSSTLEGITTIRSSKCEELLIHQFDQHQDIHTSSSFLAICCTSAFGLWLDLLCVSFVCCVVLFFIILDKYIYISGSFIGLAIFNSMSMVGLFQFCIRTVAETVDYLTNIERILDYTALKEENDIKSNDGFVPRPWPCNGDIEFKNLSLRYFGEDRLVLQNISLKILSSEKIGIVGRTGAGKSSIISALFRLSPINGEVFIDGVNIQNIDLKKLRREISIIPQEPILFSNSVRFNLDPYFEYPDERIWKILAEVELDKTIPSLDFQLTDAGNNISVGQRQLICLARAILRENKILILDEATANVDTRTDELIHETIRRKFHNATVLTVAHRLNSIMASDRVLVIDAGKVVEFDSPSVLMQRKNGFFKKLVEEAGSSVGSSIA